MSADRHAAIDASEAADNPLFDLLYRYGRPHWPQFGVGLVAQLAAQVPRRFTPLVVGVAYDAVFLRTAGFDLPLIPGRWVPDGRMPQFWFAVALIVGAYAAGTVLSVTSTLGLGWFNQRLLLDVRTDTYEAMQQLPLSFFEGERTGEIISILNNDVENLQSFAGDALTSIVRFPLSVAVAFAFMALRNWQLAALLLFVPVLVAAISYWFANVLAPIYRDLRARIGDLNAQFENNVSGVATIKAYTAEDREAERVRAVGRRRLDAHLRQLRVMSAAGPSAVLVGNAGLLVVVLLGGYWALRGPPGFLGGTMTAGTLLTFFMYANSFVDPMRELPSIVNSYENARASAERVVDLLADPDVLPERPDARRLEDVAGRVAFDGVTFSYPDATGTTLRNVTITADAGETVGLVGPTGAGKSTLAKLLFRFYDPDEGVVRVDGTDVRDVSLRSLRSSLGYVGQEPFLFYGTIRENIAYGTDADDEAVREAAERAGAHEFITELPSGYGTEVGERGLRLSGGQRQRIAIARAVVRDPAILVLDEATSHVDNETEAAIQRSLSALLADRTTFVVAHRLSTVRDADRIVVLDDGEVVERGTHEELLDRDGLYANLWRVQVGDVASLPAEFVERTRRRLEGSE